jgi:integrase
MVPAAERKALRRTRYVQSLGTRDLVEANRRKHAVIAEIRQRIAAAQAHTHLPPDTAERILIAAQDARRAVDRGELGREEAEVALDAQVELFLDAAGARLGRDHSTGHPLLPESEVQAVRLAHKVLESGDVSLLSDCARDYLAEVAPTIRKQTLRTKNVGLDDFSAFVGAKREVATITRKLAGRFVAEVINPRDQSHQTKRAAIGQLSTFFNWLERRGEIDSNPFTRLAGSIRESTRGKVAKRRPWTNDELGKLLAGIPANDPLWSCAAIAAYTGMRREEVAQLRVNTTSADALTATEGKTQAAVRTVPVHPALRPLIERLRAASTDGFLISGLLTGGADNKRGHYIGKRFSKHIRALGFTDTALTFHTLRNSFMQRCEEAGIPEATTKLLVGHTRESLTYGLYSPGVSAEILAAAMRRVSYGKVDTTVRRAGAKVELENKARRRRKRAPKAA